MKELAGQKLEECQCIYSISIDINDIVDCKWSHRNQIVLDGIKGRKNIHVAVILLILPTK